MNSLERENLLDLINHDLVSCPVQRNIFIKKEDCIAVLRPDEVLFG